MIATFALVFTLGCIILNFFKSLKVSTLKIKHPPGPPTLPLLGNLHQLKISDARPIFEAFRLLCMKYGPIVRLKIGSTSTVLIDDGILIKEILQREEFEHRYTTPATLERSYGKHLGIIWNNGKPWKEIRRFTIKTLRDFGFGKTKSMESVIEDEMNQLIQKMDALILKHGGAVEMNQFFVLSVLNVIWSMIAGIRFKPNDEKLLELVTLVANLSRTSPAGGTLLTIFPFLRHVLPVAAKRREDYVKLHSYFHNALAERKKLGMYKIEQNDFIDAFLAASESTMKNIFNDQQFNVLITDLFQAGTETTSNTLEFGILYMILNPSVQTKVRNEIHTILGKSRFPVNDDRKRMPYTEATILEILRTSNVLPINAREAVCNTYIGCYQIPKGTPIICNMYASNMSAKVWGDPENFRPERFLDCNNNIINSSQLYAFGFGKRVCIGEQVARVSLFCFFTSLLQNYSFQTCPGEKPTILPQVGFSLAPKTYKAIVTKA